MMWTCRFVAVVAACLLATASSSVGAPVGPVAPVNVFELGEAGYYCMKIPYVLTTFKGTILAFAEARNNSCSDYAPTDLVMKRSTDNGFTWSPLVVVHRESTLDKTVVIGNANPVQDRATNRILLPFCRNNSKVMLSYSDDDGLTWAPPVNVTSVDRDDWKWIGLGPPRGLQLASGRILLPAYHSPTKKLDGTFTHTHIIYSDDHGSTWQIGQVWDDDTDKNFSNECQVVELQNNTVMISARTLTTKRSSAISHDGGMTWSDMELVDAMPEPIDGVEGSIFKHDPTQWVFFTNPNEDSIFGLRYNMTLKVSKDYAKTWTDARQVDAGPSGYSALTVTEDNNIGLLYEVSNMTRIVFLPTAIVYQVVFDFQ